MRGPSPSAATATARPGTASNDWHVTSLKQERAASSPLPETFTAASMRVHQRKNTISCSSGGAEAKAARAANGKNSATTSAMPGSVRIGSTSMPTGASAERATAHQRSRCDRLNSVFPKASRGFPCGPRQIGTAAGGQPSCAASNLSSNFRAARNASRCGTDWTSAARSAPGSYGAKRPASRGLPRARTDHP